MRRRLLLALVCCARLGAQEVLFEDDFAANGTGWLLDEQWEFAGGALVCHGLDGKILLLDATRPQLTDFRADLRARLQRAPAIDQVHGFGLVYRYDKQTGNGYFIDFGLGGLYGFGVISDQRFELTASGQSPLLEGDGQIQIEARGAVHTLRCGGELVDVWRDDRFPAGGFGLLCIGPIEVGFDHLRIEGHAGGPPSSVPHPLQLGPTPPAGGTNAPLGRVLRRGDVELAGRWRRQWNQIAASLGEAQLAPGLDACDVAVLGLLRYQCETGIVAPAEVLAGLFGERGLIEGGAVGPGPQAAVEFWLAYAASEPGRGEPTADVLAGLAWYFALRREAETAWGERVRHPLRVTNDLRMRLDGDRGRFERVVPAAELDQRRREVQQVAQQIRALLPEVTAPDGA